jgi:acyl carrier protein
MSRIAGATQKIRRIVFEATDDIELEAIGPDDDLKEDLDLNVLELLSVCLIVSDVFGVDVPDGIFETPLYRTPAALAEWVIGQAEEAAWAERRMSGPHAQGRRRA